MSSWLARSSFNMEQQVHLRNRLPAEKIVVFVGAECAVIQRGTVGIHSTAWPATSTCGTATGTNRAIAATCMYRYIAAAREGRFEISSFSLSSDCSLGSMPSR